MYLRDPSFKKNRTLTVARRRISDTEMELAYTINRVTKDIEAYAYNAWRPEEFEADVFVKSRGRTIAKGLLQSKDRRFVITKDKDTPFYVAVLNFLENDAPHGFAQKLGAYYNSQRRKNDVTAVNVQKVA